MLLDWKLMWAFREIIFAFFFCKIMYHEYNSCSLAKTIRKEWSRNWFKKRRNKNNKDWLFLNIEWRKTKHRNNILLILITECNDVALRKYQQKCKLKQVSVRVTVAQVQCFFHLKNSQRRAWRSLHLQTRGLNARVFRQHQLTKKYIRGKTK